MVLAFVTHILEKFGQRGGTSTSRKKISRNSIAWNDIGVAVSSVFGKAYGCSTVIGPMDAKLKPRRVYRKRSVKPTKLARPEELVEGTLLHKVQTVENLFTLSFLVKHGRAEIKVDRAGCHLISPRNAPAAKSVASKDVALSHFVFRLDYNTRRVVCQADEFVSAVVLKCKVGGQKEAIAGAGGYIEI
ncbi:non-structural maintenance of chromosomes element protein A [Trifolium repens]|nr:non-structural maintenance of chromosomes element protein A [Trifolium repens]